MKKLLLVLISVLFLAGQAFAAEYNQAATAELVAQWKGNSVTSDSSVIMDIWYTGTGVNPLVGVSNNSSILLYAGVAVAYTVDLASTSYDTIGEAVDYIDGLTDWEAAVGKDAYRAISSKQCLAESAATVGIDEANAYTVALDTSVGNLFTCGVKANSRYTNRLKSITTQVSSAGDNITIYVYDKDTIVWQKYLTDAVYTTTTAAGNSTNTIVFVTAAEKGLSATKGNSLVVVADSDGVLDTNAVAKAQNVVSIIYDQLGD